MLGFLFEHYMYTSSGYSINRTWLTDINKIRNGGVMSTDRQIFYKQKCKSAFSGWLLNHIINVGSNGRRQMFYLTFLLKYYGLSRDGIVIMSRYGFGVTLDMFDELRSMYKAGSDGIAW